MSALKDTFLIARQEARVALSSRRVLVLVTLFLLFSALVLLIASGVTGKIEEQARAQLATGADTEAMLGALRQQVHRPLLAGMFGITDEHFLERAEKWPLVTLILLKATWFFLPLYIALMGFDQLSAEVSTRSIRYLLIRTPRRSVLLGKWLAQVAILSLILVLVSLGTAVYVWWREQDAGFTGTLALELRFAAVSVVFALVYSAITSLCSALARTAAVALTVNFIVLFALWLLETLGQLFAGPGSALRALSYLSPWHYASGLVHTGLREFLAAFVAHVGFAAVALGLAGLLLRTEDL